MQVFETKNVTQTKSQLALNIFTRNGFSVRLLGNGQSPMFILDDRFLLSCFLNGHSLHFRHSPDSGDILRSVKLAGDAYITKYEISELIEQSEHLPVYRIQDIGSEMCLVGFNHFDQEEETNRIDGRYPVFAHHNPLIYINPDKAELVSRELMELGYNVKII